MHFEELFTHKFGKLLPIEESGRAKSGHILIKCRCDCGNIKITTKSNLLSGHVKSCGCILPQHGLSKIPEYKIWEAMKRRCYSRVCNGYKNYGGRGIFVCERWHSFVNFYKDMGERPDGLTLERIDNNKEYSLSNCKWATRTEQSRNQKLKASNRTGTKGVFWSKGEKKYVAQIGVDYRRIRLGAFDNIREAILARENGEQKYFSQKAGEAYG